MNKELKEFHWIGFDIGGKDLIPRLEVEQAFLDYNKKVERFILKTLQSQRSDLLEKMKNEKEIKRIIWDWCDKHPETCE